MSDDLVKQMMNPAGLPGPGTYLNFVVDLIADQRTPDDVLDVEFTVDKKEERPPVGDRSP